MNTTKTLVIGATAIAAGLFASQVYAGDSFLESFDKKLKATEKEQQKSIESIANQLFKEDNKDAGVYISKPKFIRDGDKYKAGISIVVRKEDREKVTSVYIQTKNSNNIVERVTNESPKITRYADVYRIAFHPEGNEEIVFLYNNEKVKVIKLKYKYRLVSEEQGKKINKKDLKNISSKIKLSDKYNNTKYMKKHVNRSNKRLKAKEEKQKRAKQKTTDPDEFIRKIYGRD